jgi:peptide/nickel transport system ATP-binding protein
MQLLKIDNLTIDFKVDDGYFQAVKNLSFDLNKGEILALVGESGSGKSVTCMAITRLLPEHQARYTTGKITFDDNGKELDIFSLPKKELRKVRGGKIAYIFQEPSVSLNPVFRIGDQIAESIILHQPEIGDIKAEVISLLKQVGIPAPEQRMDCYPHEMSGGMQQRIMIAMALASKPELLIADEPTTALDVTIQAQILDLLAKIGKERGMSIIIVTHNLGIVAETADRAVVMYAGEAVEIGEVEQVLHEPKHPYTKALLASVPTLGYPGKKLMTIPDFIAANTDSPEVAEFFEKYNITKTVSEV